MHKAISFLIQTVAPLHLGCDEVYEPFNAVFDLDQKCLIAFDPYDFLARLPDNDRSQFLNICQKGTIGSILEIYKFMARHAKLAQGRAVPVTQALLQHYKKVLELREQDFSRQLQKFLIHRSAFLPLDQRPYIPGAAIKGAMRTAYLNSLAQKERVPLSGRDKEDGQGLEKKLLNGSFQTDPFRLLKISDFLPVGEVKTRILYAINMKKEGGRGRGPYQILEVIEPDAWFQGTIHLEEWPEEMRQAARELQKNISRPIKANTLWQSIAHFFTKEKAREDEELFAVGLPKFTLPLSHGDLPLRLGRHSGAECLTLEGYRSIKIKTARDRYEIKDHATTLWLAAHAPENFSEPPRPFGWVILRRITEELENKCSAREHDWQEKQKSRIKPALPAAEAKVESKPTTQAPPPAIEVWEKATLTWNPGKQELTAMGPRNKKATGRGLDFIPEAHRAKLKKKGLQATVTVEPLGNAWKIIKIEVPGP